MNVPDINRSILRLHDLAGVEVAKPRHFRASRSQCDSLRS
jgi:hypothetical protein